MMRLLVRSLTCLLFCGLSNGCALKFEVTSQRTALENQILGAYEELDQDLVLMASVRAIDENGEVRNVELSDLQEAAVRARQNQQFNHDDIEEFKTRQFIGEGNNGELSVLPEGIGQAIQATSSELRLIRILIAEENRDRKTIWKRINQQSPDLGDDDIETVITNFVARQREVAKTGQWLQDDAGVWYQKS